MSLRKYFVHLDSRLRSSRLKNLMIAISSSVGRPSNDISAAKRLSVMSGAPVVVGGG